MDPREAPRSTVSIPLWLSSTLRYLVALLVAASVFWLLARAFVSDVSVSYSASVAVFALIWFTNAFLVPILFRPLIKLPGWIFALLSFALSGLVVFVADALILSWDISSLWNAVIVSAVMGLITFLTIAILSFNDHLAWSRYALRPVELRFGSGREHINTVPGIAFLEIDGLSVDTLEFAMDHGYTPNLNRWRDEGSHNLVRWECDLSSQTGASQAGILLGSNHNYPAYRWYDRELGRVVVSTNDAALLESRLSDGDGLLVDGGSSRGNMFSGDATDSLFTFATLRIRASSPMRVYYALFANAYNVTRTLALFIADILKELVAATWQWMRREEPRVRRFGIYPFVRASTTSLLRELSTYTVAADMMRGVPAMYTTYVAYDEVAHHSGIRRGDTMRVLRDIDRDIGRLEREAEQAGRPYHLVVLSDHGQSQGATFLQLTGKSLGTLVTDLISGSDDIMVRAEVETHLTSDEGRELMSALLSDVASSSVPMPASLRDMIQRPVADSEISVTDDGSLRKNSRYTATTDEDVVVVASGNLGLIAFPFSEKRLTADEINARFPALLPGLVLHDHIGFVMVQNENREAIVYARSGTHNLTTGSIIGTDPLAPFSVHAKQHLLRTHSFDNVPDILVGSSYNEETGEVHAFEELVGSHGGLGGGQTRPFLLYPSTLALIDEEIVGAEALHRQLKYWRLDVRDGAHEHV